MIECDCLPTPGRMALPAGLTKLPAVVVVRLVAGVAGLRCAAVLVSKVALGAGRLLVPAPQRVGRRAMIEGGPLPALRGVALGAILAQLHAMRVIRLVAGPAVLRGSTVLVSGMALCAVYLLVFTPQRIGSQTVIKGGPLPALEGVALDAVLAQLPAMRVVRLMARPAIGR